MKKPAFSPFLSGTDRTGSQLDLLEMLFDRMPMSIVVIDRDYRIVRNNPTWAKFIERYTPTKASDVQPGAKIFDLEPGNEKVLIPLFERAFCGETVEQNAMRIESGGIVSYWDIVLTPLYDGDHVVGLSAVSIDATERVMSEQHLKDALIRLEESESMLRSVIDNAERFGIYRIQLMPGGIFDVKVMLVSPSIADMMGVEDPYNFRSWYESIHPEDLPRVIEASDRARKEGIPYNQQSRCFNKRTNRWTWVRTISNPGYDAEGRLTHFDGIVVDQTAQKEAELALQELNITLERRVEDRTRELERRRMIAESLRDIIRMINSSLPLEAFLDQAVRMAAQRLGAGGCVLHRFDMERRVIVHVANYGVDGIYEKGRSGPFEDLNLFGGEDYLHATLLRQPTFGNYPPLPRRVEEIAGTNLPAGIKAERIALRQRFAGYFSVPLFIQDKIYGGLVFYYTEPQDFSEEQIQLGLTFAEQVALAIENAMLRMQAAQAATLSERTRLARDLHDAVSQTLFSSSLIADVLPILWEKKPEIARQKLEELRLLTRGALAEMRTLLLELRPASLVDMDLADLIRHLTNAFAGRTRVPVKVNIEGDVDPPSDVKEVIYRVVQESLNNINKHAQASEVVLDVLRSEHEIRLEIRDNGCGFNLREVPLESLGLGIMRERASTVGAALAIESSVGSGTRVELIWRDSKNG